MARPTAHPVTVAAAIGLLVLGGCARSPREQIGPALRNEPTIRVRIVRDADELRLTGPAAVKVRTASGSFNASVRLPLSVRLVADQWRINGQRLPSARLDPLHVDPDPPTPDLRVDDRPYPGRLRLLPRTDGRQLFDVINHVHLEAYLPGVLDRELYDDWSLATYHAQAIAARSYAIHRILEYGRQRAFDVEATQTSQVYGGSAVNPRSNRAVLETTGLVLAENDRVIPAFYSSACGGRGASPGDTWGQSLDYQALQPAPHQPWCRHASHFRWGPIRRRLDDLRARIAGWGRSKNKPLADLKQIATIVISRRNPVGRPAEFTLTDVTGRRYRLVADSFRMACNYSGDRKLPSDQRLRSADVEIQMHARHVELTGRGFGHGVGLCQWGAQAMAQAGHHAERILKTYYPGATIQRAY